LGIKNRINKSLEESIKFINTRVKENKDISNETIGINVSRLYYLCIILIPLILTNIMIILIKYRGMEVQGSYWKLLMGMHLYIFVLLPILVYFSKEFKDKNIVNSRTKILVYSAIAKIFIVGIAFTSIDQIVTSSIVIYLMMMVLVGVVFVIRPTISIIYYAVSLILFIMTIRIFQTDKNILISITMDGLAATIVSFSISFITWKTNKKAIQQNNIIQEQQRELERNNNKLSNIAFFDYMTSLYNRRKIDEIIKEELNWIKRNGHESAIIIFDIDNFKLINDKYGHPTGDKVIKELSKLIEGKTRGTDSVGRWGGEEFLILLPFTHISTAERIAEKLRKIIEDHTFKIDDLSISITASFGVTCLCEKDLEFKEEAYNKADKALYKAKRENKNCVVVME